jgi:uncharacterized protein HemX
MEEEKNTNLEQVQTEEQPTAPVEGTVFQEKESKIGPMIGSIIVIIIIIVGGIYFWSQQVEDKKTDMKNNTPQTEEIDPIKEAEEIEAELDDLGLEDLDAELDAIDAEFEAI